jgi:hypothetical protein
MDDRDQILPGTFFILDFEFSILDLLPRRWLIVCELSLEKS